MALPLRVARTLALPGAPAPVSGVDHPVPELPPGLLVELSGEQRTARLSSVVTALRAAQIRGETTAWIQNVNGFLYPPDLAEAGVDLASLAIIRVPSPGRSADAGLRPGIIRATEMLARSGAFGLLVVDVRSMDAGGLPVRGGTLSPPHRRLPPAWQGRLLGAARDSGSRIIFLSSHARTRESVGSLVGLRLEPQRVRVAPGIFAIEHHVLKNKPGLPFAEASEIRRGPWGLR